MVDLDKPLSARAFIFISIGLGVEYSMLSLLEDSTGILKVFTIICGSLLIYLMWEEEKVKKISSTIFYGAVIILWVIWSIFATYAIHQYFHRQWELTKLREYYNKSSHFIKDEMAYDNVKQQDFMDGYKTWEKEVGDWILNNVGITANVLFFDRSEPTTFMPHGPAQNQPLFIWGDCNSYQCYRARFEMDRRHLAELIKNLEAYHD